MSKKRAKVREIYAGRRISYVDGKRIDHGPVKWTVYEQVEQEEAPASENPPDEEGEERKSA